MTAGLLTATRSLLALLALHHHASTCVCPFLSATAEQHQPSLQALISSDDTAYAVHMHTQRARV